MSLNVLIIAEDYRNDQFILKPIVNAMLDRVGKPNANLRICKDPLIEGDEDALDSETIEDVIFTNRMVDLYLFLIDRDAEPHRHKRLRRVENDASSFLRSTQDFFAGQAHQEVEVWLLAGQPDVPEALDASWGDVREERQAKEQYYVPYVEQKTLTNAPGGGRKPLGQTAGANYADRVRQLCDEVQALEERISATVT